MARLTCPWCGRRAVAEFHYGGEAERARPSQPERLDDAAWADYLFNADNPKGPAKELWLHRHGCGRWFVATRDTRTDELLGTEP